jgi:hypothetical protein
MEGISYTLLNLHYTVCTVYSDRGKINRKRPEAEFLDVIQTKDFLSLFTVTSTMDLLPPLNKSGLKLVCNVIIVYTETSSLRTLKKPQRYDIVRS